MDGGETAVEESEPSVSLRLGIGAGDGARGPATGKAAKEQLTHAQLSELHRQSLVCKCLAARLPVPHNLLLPLRKSDACCSLQTPSTSVGLGCVGALDYMNRMSPGLERCRRTDGKKWQCGKNVVPNQKYCERHVNRGRQRSRKPVEVSEIASPSATRTASKTTDHDLRNSNADIPLELRLDAGLSPGITCKNKSSLNGKPGYRTSVINVNSSSSIGKCQGRNCVDERENFPRNWVGVNNGIRSNVFLGLGFSPMSVLQGNYLAERSLHKRIKTEAGVSDELLAPLEQRNLVLTVIGRTAPFRPKMELEPWRCRRTDGKKWRCRRDVLPDHKYCLQHIHRGSKTLPQALGAAVINRGRSLAISMTAHSPKRANLDTSLSISTPAASRKYEKSGSTISSSESESDTTLSDTTVAAYE